MKKYQSRRTGQVATVVNQTDKTTTLRIAGGETKELSNSTIRRWWTLVLDTEKEHETSLDKQVTKLNAGEVDPEKEPIETPKSKKKVAKPKNNKSAEPEKSVITEDKKPKSVKKDNGKGVKPVQPPKPEKEQEEVTTEPIPKNDLVNASKPRQIVSGGTVGEIFDALAIDKGFEVFAGKCGTFISYKINGAVVAFRTSGKSKMTFGFREQLLNDEVKKYGYKIGHNRFSIRVVFGATLDETQLDFVSRLLDRIKKYKEDNPVTIRKPRAKTKKVITPKPPKKNKKK